MSMRSDLVFGAYVQVPNRYQLCRLTSHATRKLHKPNDRIQDTVNDVLTFFRKANPIAEAGVFPKPTASLAASPVPAFRSVAPPIEHLDLTRVALNHVGLSSERIGA
jgi:hypothetical protein